MSLFISLDKKIYNECLYEKHIGESVNHLSDKIDHIVSIQADEDELVHILNCYECIPYHRHNMLMIWHGDIAKFIVANLNW